MFTNKIKTVFKLLMLTIALSTVLNFVGLQASADVGGDVGNFIGDLFRAGEKGVSFVQYEGQLAQLSTEGYDTALTASTDFRGFVIRIVNFALGFLGLIAVIIVIYGGVLYVTAAGNEEKTQTGKKAITYAVIGLLIVLGSFAFVNTIIKGAGAGEDSAAGTSLGSTGTTYSAGGFNASSELVRALAVDILNGFSFLEDATEDLKNIRNDAQKSSLDPERLPTKPDILNFLYSVQSKLSNIKSKLQPFSVSEARINEILRDIEKDIDTVSSLSTQRYIKKSGGTAEYCDVDEERGFGEGLLDASDAKICANSGYNFSYIEGLYEAWFQTSKKYTATAASGSGTDLYSLITPISGDYANTLEQIFIKLDALYTTYGNIEAVKQGAATSAYQTMSSATGYGYSVQNGKVSENGQGLLSLVKTWTLDSSVDAAGQKLLTGLQQQSILYEALKNLQYVQAKLTANVVEGSAPLTVLFDALGTVDPAGGSIQGSNITWDLAGTKKTTELINAASGTTLLPPSSEGSISCEFPTPPGKTEKDFIGESAKRCIFHRPGTYTAAVKINSNEPTKYAPGISILTIKVRPPNTKIELSLTSGNQTHSIMHYEGDILVTDRRSINVTANDAKSGLTFDASKTNAEQFKWNFGDSDIRELSQSPKITGKKYLQSGKYEVTLEVINSLGILDRKIFSLEISPIAAIVVVTPQNSSFVNSPVTFDASGSKSDLGKIINYAWTIEPAPNQNIPADIQAEISKTYPINQSGSNLKTFTHEFKFPIKYNIKVEVTDDGGNKDDTSISNYRIESQPPVALFDYQIPDETQPGTVHFNGGTSYDPDGTNKFGFEWTIEPQKGWEVIKPDDHGLKSKQPIVKFKEKGEYNITLKVQDNLAEEEKNEITKTVKIDNVLDIAWDSSVISTAILNADGEAEITFKIKSDNAVAYEIDFGDEKSDEGEIKSSATIKHTYSEAGKYLVKVTAYDAEDNENVLQRNFLIGDSQSPIAKIGMQINGDEVADLSKTIEVSRKDILTFDGSESKNTDGTGRNLKYSWDFGDTKNSTKKKATYTYKEITPKEPGFYTVKLQVSDKDDPTKISEDEIKVKVVNEAPKFSSVQAITSSFQGDLITPVTVTVKVYGIEDKDGQVTKYKWWYFDGDDPDEQLGIQVTQNNTAQLVIGTRGKEGQELTYGFGLEITDNDDLSYSNIQSIEDKTFSKITVVNGKNDLPVAKFNVETTKVFVGDKVTFINASSDSDGKIVKYIWDVEGDGFHNNEPTEKSSIEHIYAKKNLEGYPVRLKVVDDKGGEDVSDEVKIYVDSLANPPKAAFKYKVVPNTQGMKVLFENNSKSDEEADSKIISYSWDFDNDSAQESADSDGDGLKNNDVDSQAEKPEFKYEKPGNYTVTLTVTDDQGNTAKATNKIVIPMANAPKAAFTYEIKDGEVVFENNSTADEKNNAKIEQYIWDFDTASKLKTADKDGDGDKSNDKESSTKNPVHKYEFAGEYQVKLTVIDDQGNRDEVLNKIDYTLLSTDIDSPIIGDSTEVIATDNSKATQSSTTTTNSTISPAASTQTSLQASTNTSGNNQTATTQPKQTNSLFDITTTTAPSTKTTNPTTPSPIKAVLVTDPLPDASNVVYLTGQTASVKLDFSKSQGKIAYYIIDKNIYFDTDGNGIKNDDQDFKTALAGRWTTNFDKAWGKIEVALKVQDISGNVNTTTVPVKFK